jgi:hypothetical protein
MTGRSLSRRLERLEARLTPAKEEPVVIVIHSVAANGLVVGQFRLMPGGLQRLTPDDGEYQDTTRRRDEGHCQAIATA